MNFFKRHRHAKQTEEHRNYLLERVEEQKRELEHLRKMIRAEYELRDPCRVCGGKYIIEHMVNNVLISEPCECTRT
jgi:hypothetical protein